MRFVELFEDITLTYGVNTSSFTRGQIITTDDFVEKLNTDLNTTII